MKIYIGGLPFTAIEEEIAQLAVAFGELHSITIPVDRAGRSRGFAFIEMLREKDALAAIAELHQTEFGGRRIQVRQARENPRVASRESRKAEEREESAGYHDRD